MTEEQIEAVARTWLPTLGMLVWVAFVGYSAGLIAAFCCALTAWVMCLIFFWEAGARK